MKVLKIVQSTPSSKLYVFCVSEREGEIEGMEEYIANLIDQQSRQTNIYVVV